MKFGDYIRWGLLGAAVGLLIGIALTQNNRLDFDRWDLDTVFAPKAFTQTATQMVARSDINLPDGSTIPVELKDRNTILTAIAKMQCQYGDVTGALRAAERIQDPNSRDVALYYLLTVTANANSIPKSTGAAPGSVTPPVSPSDALERKRQVAEQIVTERKILDAMTDHGMRAIAWCRIASRYYSELDDRKNGQDGFTHAVEEAEKIEVAAKEPALSVKSPTSDKSEGRRGIILSVFDRIAQITVSICITVGGIIGVLALRSLERLTDHGIDAIKSKNPIKRTVSWLQNRRGKKTLKTEVNESNGPAHENSSQV
jgi:hypothetical protein